MRKRCILIADDDPDDQLIIQDVLKDLAISDPVQVFEDGQQVLDYLGSVTEISKVKNLPGILLLDLRMPKKNGFEVLQCLKQHPVWKLLPVAVLSTSNQERDIQMAYRLGANGYFVKSPYYQEMREILRIIHAYWMVYSFPPDYEKRRTNPETQYLDNA